MSKKVFQFNNKPEKKLFSNYFRMEALNLATNIKSM